MNTAEAIPEPLIQSIHKSSSSTKLVIAMAGNGTQAISELMRYGNGSATLLAQHLLYDNAAFNRYIGGKPDKYVSAHASRKLAMAAYMESQQIASASAPTAGIGCTSSLVKPDGEREGREHFIFVSTQDQLHTRTMSIKLDASLKRSRVEQEWINALAILQAVGDCRGASDSIGEMLQQRLASTDVVDNECNTHPAPALSEVIHGRASCYLREGVLPESPCVVCAGSFNPLHPAHIQLLKLAEVRTALPGVFELSVTNVDKPPLDFLEIEKRSRQFEQRSLPLVVTNRPRYLGKIEVFPAGSAFVMGCDTFSRLVDPRYYQTGETPLDLFEARGTRFIVAARREKDGTVMSGHDVIQRLGDSPATADAARRWDQLTYTIPTNEFLMDMSSSAIRSGQLKIGCD
jgi:hypothetical protein